MEDGNVVSRSIGMEKRELVTKERERGGADVYRVQGNINYRYRGSSVWSVM